MGTYFNFVQNFHKIEFCNKEIIFCIYVGWYMEIKMYLIKLNILFGFNVH
jgi:hypothetical protein